MTIPQRIVRAVEQPGVGTARLLEPSVDEGGQSAFLSPRMDESRAHDRRECDRHDAGQDDGDGQRAGELQEQRPRPSTLESNGGMHGGERDGYRDDWAERLASCDLGRLDARLPQPHMPLDVFDDHDGIVHD